MSDSYKLMLKKSSNERVVAVIHGTARDIITVADILSSCKEASKGSILIADTFGNELSLHNLKRNEILNPIRT